MDSFFLGGAILGYVRFEVIMRKWSQYVENLFQLVEYGIYEHEVIYKKNLKRVEKILRNFYVTYEQDSFKMYRDRCYIKFSEIEEALELQSFLINQTTVGKAYDVLIISDEYDSKSLSYNIKILKKSVEESLPFN